MTIYQDVFYQINITTHFMTIRCMYMQIHQTNLFYFVWKFAKHEAEVQQCSQRNHLFILMDSFSRVPNESSK